MNMSITTEPIPIKLNMFKLCLVVTLFAMLPLTDIPRSLLRCKVHIPIPTRLQLRI